MNSKYNGELRLADGTPVRIVGDLPIGEWTPVTSNGPRAKWDSIETSVHFASGTLTSAGIDALMDIVDEHYSTQPEVCFYVNRHMYWQIEYARQGKRYPRPRRQRSKARMSKKWRDRA